MNCGGRSIILPHHILDWEAPPPSPLLPTCMAIMSWVELYLGGEFGCKVWILSGSPGLKLQRKCSYWNYLVTVYEKKWKTWKMLLKLKQSPPPKKKNFRGGGDIFLSFHLLTSTLVDCKLYICVIIWCRSYSYKLFALVVPNHYHCGRHCMVLHCTAMYWNVLSCHVQLDTPFVLSLSRHLEVLVLLVLRLGSKL